MPVTLISSEILPLLIRLTEQSHDTCAEREADDDKDGSLPRTSVVVSVEDELVGLDGYQKTFGKKKKKDSGWVPR